jgi:hypothetical protein
MSGKGSSMRGNATTSRRVERQRHIKRISCKGGAMRGNATNSWRVERQQHIERMSGKGGATRSDVTTSQGKQETNWSGRWRRRVERQQHAEKTSCRGRVPRGITTTSQRVERRLCIKRMGGKGGATRSNGTTSRGKQKANRKWEVEAGC